jgi:type IV secretion system protein TrbC
MKRAIKISFMVVVLLLFTTVLASSQSMPWESGLEKIMNSLAGPTAKIIGVILIVGAGITVAVTEGQAIKKVAWVIVGIGIAFNAASFLSMLFPNAGV